MNHHRPDNVEQLQPYLLGVGKTFDALADAVVVTDAAIGRVAYWNAAAETIFGYTKAEAVGMPLETLMPDRIKELHRAGLARYNRTGRGGFIDARQPVELPAQRKDGEEIAIELTLTALDEVPVPGRFVMAVIRDITARIRTDEQLRQSHTRLQAELAEKRRQPVEDRA